MDKQDQQAIRDEIEKCDRELLRLRGICMACPGPSLKPFGGDVHLDAYPDGIEQAMKCIIIAPDYAPQDNRPDFRLVGVSNETAEVLARTLADIATLTDRQSSVFVGLLRGETLPEVARRLSRKLETDEREIVGEWAEVERWRPEIMAILRLMRDDPQGDNFTPPSEPHPDGSPGGSVIRET